MSRREFASYVALLLLTTACCWFLLKAQADGHRHDAPAVDCTADATVSVDGSEPADIHIEGLC